MKESFALIFGTLALSISLVGILAQLGIVKIGRIKEDKYEQWRNKDGLLGRKRE